MPSFLLSNQLAKWKDGTLQFILEECGGGGSCLFYCVAEGMSRLINQTWSMEYVRDRVANSITSETLPLFIDSMIEDQSQQTRVDGQRINHSYDLNSLRTLISSTGTAFQGTDIVIRWLLTYDPVFTRCAIGFILFSSFGPGYTQILNEESAEHFILLFNYANMHWQLMNVIDDNNHGFSSVNKKTLQILKPYL
jgi:hypothetical protein